MWTVVRQVCFQEKQRRHCLDRFFFFFKNIFEPFQLGEAALAWHALEPQEARQVLEGAPQPCSARGQHAPAVHQALLAHGQARCQRRPRREHRRDVLPPPAGASDRDMKQAQL